MEYALFAPLSSGLNIPWAHSGVESRNQSCINLFTKWTNARNNTHISHNGAVGPLQDYFARSNGRPADVGQYLLCDDAGVRGRYSELHLRSVFQPILDAATLEPRAHEALLRARVEDGAEVSPQATWEATAKREWSSTTQCR